MLQPSEIDQIYLELEKQFVRLDPSPELGLAYVKDRLTLCRAMQDRLGELRLRVNRAWSDVLERLLIAQQLDAVKTTPDSKKQIGDLKVLKERHSMLAKMVGAQATALSRTAMDIRLLAEIVQDQLKRGEIEPPTELIRDVPVTEITPFEVPAPPEPPPPEPEPTPAPTPAPTPTIPQMAAAIRGRDYIEAPPFVAPPPGDGRASPSPDFNPAVPFTPGPTPPVEPPRTLGPFVSFDDPLPEAPAEKMQLADTSAVPFESLFEESPHGSGRVF